MTFNEKLVRLRKIKGITQDELASAVGVSRQAVYKWESGQSYPEVPKLIEMKAIFGISIDDLLDESYEVVLPEKKRRKRAPKADAATVKEAITPPTAEEEEIVETAPIAEEEQKSSDAETPKEAIPEVAPTERAVKEETYPAVEEEKKVGFFQRLFGRK